MLYGFTAIFHLLLYWFTAILEYLNSSSWSPDNEYLITGGEDDLVVVST